MKRIWLIGGTQESVRLAQRLVEGGHRVIITITTESARSLYRPHPNLDLLVGRLVESAIAPFLTQYRIGAILDVSHPFAVQVSQMAIATALAHAIPYLRYERPIVPAHDASTNREISAEEPYPNGFVEHTLDSLDTLLTGDYLRNQRVLLTLGSRWLPPFTPWQRRATLFVRILPSLTAMSTALEAGFTPNRIIALRPPISAELERSLWQQWQISTVVTKASGAPGGEDIKRQVAQELGVTLITLARPTLHYPNRTGDLDEAIAWCRYQIPIRPSKET